jgi:DNA-directed RNA polymerase subunit beta'
VALDVLQPGTEEVLAPAGTLLDEKWVEMFELAGVDESKYVP